MAWHDQRHLLMYDALNRLIGQPDCVLLANGTYPTHPMACHFLHTLPVVCCDGAANAFVAQGGTPTAIVGDSDSLCDDLRHAWADRLFVIPEQDTNDLTKALHWAHTNGYTRPLILGATGKREDHTLGNIVLLAHYAQRGHAVVGMLTDHGLFVPCQDSLTLHMPIGTRLSVFSFGAEGMASHGLQYPLYPLTTLWQGTLNRTTHSPFTIEAQGHYLLYFPLPEV